MDDFLSHGLVDHRSVGHHSGQDSISRCEVDNLGDIATHKGFSTRKLYAAWTNPISKIRDDLFPFSGGQLFCLWHSPDRALLALDIAPQSDAENDPGRFGQTAVVTVRPSLQAAVDELVESPP